MSQIHTFLPEEGETSGQKPIKRDWLFVTPPTAKSIKARVAAEHGLTVADLEGPSRKRRIAYARFQAIREIKAKTKLSKRQIGALFNRDHSTVCHALGVLTNRKPSDLREAA